jgi:hypothetical protein
VRGDLVGEDATRCACLARVEEQEVVAQRASVVGASAERLDVDRPVRLERVGADAAVRGDVLVLLADGSPRTSISISHASSARLAGGIATRPASASAFSKHDRERAGGPMPVPAGHVGDEAISSGSPFQWRSSDSRRIGCLISEGSSTSSNCDTSSGSAAGRRCG